MSILQALARDRTIIFLFAAVAKHAGIIERCLKGIVVPTFTAITRSEPVAAAETRKNLCQLSARAKRVETILTIKKKKKIYTFLPLPEMFTPIGC